MPKKGEQQGKDPLHNAAIPNKFYFTSNNPEQYGPIHYFNTFTDLHSSKKEVLHSYWRRALEILVRCSVRRYQSNGQRLKAEWSTPSKGLSNFWKRLEENESDQDQIRSTASVLKKRAIRSVQANTLKAFNAVDRSKHIFNCLWSVFSLF